MEKHFKIWFVIPSRNLPAARLHLPVWRKRGYRIAVLIDPPHYVAYSGLADVVVATAEYFGYPWAIKKLVRTPPISEADIVVTGGDDILPDPGDPQKIAHEVFKRFSDGLGVMQPIGDGHDCDKICGSPWMGSAFIRRINQGKGPFWPEYNHYFCDREMRLVTEELGLLWQRADLRHTHEHWSWRTGIPPEHIRKHQANHCVDQAMFEGRLQAGFPGHQLLPE